MGCPGASDCIWSWARSRPKQPQSKQKHEQQRSVCGFIEIMRRCRYGLKGIYIGLKGFKKTWLFRKVPYDKDRKLAGDQQVNRRIKTSGGGVQGRVYSCIVSFAALSFIRGRKWILAERGSRTLHLSLC